MTDRLLEKVKQNLILEHSEDDALLEQYITASVSYAESYQHIDEGYYSTHAMPQLPSRQLLCLRAISRKQRWLNWRESSDSTNASAQVWNTVNLL